MAEEDFVKALKGAARSHNRHRPPHRRAITIPVWFVSDDRALWLVSVYGSHTQWYRKLKKNRAVTIQTQAERVDPRARTPARRAGHK